MTVSSNTRKAGPFYGNGATTVFPFDFKVFEDADVLVVETDNLLIERELELGPDYTVELSTDQENDPGGSVIVAAALADDFMLTIGSRVEVDQTIEITNNGGFYPRIFNDFFDKVVILIQQLQEQLGRTLKLPFSSPSDFDATLPVPSPNGLIGWNSTGTGFVGIDPTSIATVGAYGNSRLNIFTGDGVQTDFVLTDNPVMLAAVDVSIGGVTQAGGLDFDLVSQTILFAVAPPDDARIVVRYSVGGLVPALDDVARSDGSNTQEASFRDAIGAVGSVALAAGTGGALVGYQPSQTGGINRNLATIQADYSNSVKGFGAVGDNSTDDTLAFQRAFNAFLGKPVFVPPVAGGYVVGNVGGLVGAGAGIIGLSGYQTLIKAKAGLTPGSALLYNPNAGTNSTILGQIAHLRFDLNGQNITAIDLSHCDSFRVFNIFASNTGNLGTFVKFGAPSNSSSYSNVIEDFYAQGFNECIVFGLNANQNHISRGTIVLNNVGVNAAPGGVLARLSVMNTRIESNLVGVREGAQGGVYLGYFENNTNGDFSFTTDSQDCTILPGTTTAATSTPLTNRANAVRLHCLSSDLGYYDQEDSVSRPAYIQGRQIRTAPGSTFVPTFPNFTFTDLWMQSPLLGNNVSLEAINNTNDNTVIVCKVDTNNNLRFDAFDRKASAYRPSSFGGPVGSDTALNVANLKVIGARKTGWALPTGTLTRTTFDTATVTLPQLAERLAALINDVHSGGTGSTHALVTT